MSRARSACAGPLVMKGYWNKPEETAEAFDGGWLHTGDVAREDEHGFLTIVDRKKDMIVSGGFNVFPREVEDVISTHPAVAAVGVIGVPDEKWGEAVKAVVVPRAGVTVDADELIALVKERKGSHHAPKSVDFVDAIPLSAARQARQEGAPSPLLGGRRPARQLRTHRSGRICRWTSPPSLLPAAPSSQRRRRRCTTSSPTCRRSVRSAPSAPAVSGRASERGVGAFFIGSNAMGERTWQARMRVSVADRPREFAWENLGSVDWDSPTPLVRWGYTFEPVDGGTRVEETWRILQSYSALEAFDAAAQDGLIRLDGRQHRADPVQLAGPLRGLIGRSAYVAR